MQSKSRSTTGQATPGRTPTRRFLRLLATALVAGAATVGAAAQNVVLTQSTLLGGFPNGGAFGSGTAAGSSMAVNTKGTVFLGTSYGGSLVQFDARTGAQTTLGSYSSIGPVAVDLTTNNLYIGNVYAGAIVKLPYVNGVYPAFSAPASSTATCNGADTAECTLPASVVSAYGLTSLAFDSKGNLFYATTNGGSPVDHAIYECSVACLAASSPAPVLVYQEPTSAAAQLLIGGLAFDSSQNLYFTDSAFPDQSNEKSSSSYVNQILYTGTGPSTYAAAKKVLYTFTVAAPGNYDDEITSVAVDSSNTIYFGTLFEGIFGFPSTKGIVNTTTLYTFAPGNTKTMTTDGTGNFYTVAYNTSGDALSRVQIGLLTAPQTKLGTAFAAVPFTTILNDTPNCASSTVSYTSASAGAASTEFIASNAGSCATSSITNASAIPGSFTFTPSSSGARSATITAREANGSTGTALASGIGQGSPAATPTFSPGAGTYTSIQSVALADATAGASIYYTTDGTTPTTASTLYIGPITVATSQTIMAIATAVGSATSPVGSAAYLITLPAATPTFGPAAGTYNATQKVAISDTTTGAVIHYTLDGSTPTASSPTYTAPLTFTATTTINAIATAAGYVNSAVGTATYTINLPTFSLLLTPNPVTLSASGGQGLVNVTVTPINTFGAAVTFACSGLPMGATCVFTPATVTPNGTFPVTTVLAINTAVSTSSLAPAPLFPMAAFLGGLGLLGWRKRRILHKTLRKTLRRSSLVALVLFGSVLAGLGVLAGCSGASATTRAATSATITVTATSGAIVQTGTVTATLQ